MLELVDLKPDPFQQFQLWFDEASGKRPQYYGFGHFLWLTLWRWVRLLASCAYPEAVIDRTRSMTLSTCSMVGQPSSRVVLLKHHDQNGFVFYTNYKSQKSLDLCLNPRAALLFHWPHPERQIRIEGVVERVSPQMSQNYWKSRDRGSQLGGVASPQSSKIESRQWLEDEVAELQKKFANKEIPCPSHWGGYRLIPHRFEFWEARPSRLHDRFVYESSEALQKWSIHRLAP